ncbi:rhodanese-like domain-containing protein [Weissella tructae]|uniref:Rhodanese family protein n=2 Tax=Weissella TaxID=46255 RepID=A0A075U1A4_9LACO|nr:MULTISPECIES: rhodanese-like domain-containing protein [Weissella]AIG65933.1 Rhodanese family protein [Weissella tructae]AIM63311.1 Rhodanese family protein [Weissella ceti]AIM64646.1 Rhodanese family protein [Weissella ceti]ELA07304.1 Rhodanese-like domain-containing protein [Weissella ceti NC36]
MFLNILLALFISIAIWVGFNYFRMRSLVKNNATLLESADFEEQGRGQQVVDLRDAAAFKVKHVLGARNIAYPMLKENHAALRKDKPVFLYDSNVQQAARLAKDLKNDGYSDIYILKGGFTAYTGRTKSNLV